MSLLHISPKISLAGLSHHDLSVISNACSKYSRDLVVILENENRAQQHIHYSILQAFRYEILKKITNRNQAKSTSLKMETSTAFVVFDALQYYSNHCDNYLDQAVLRRISIGLHQELPSTVDKDLSIMSELNFEH